LAKLEEALSSAQLYTQLAHIIDYHGEIASSTKTPHACRELFLEAGVESVDRAVASLQALAEGRLHVADPDKQYRFAIDLVKKATFGVEAVSYRDEGFWTTQAGKRYLQANKALIGSRRFRRAGALIADKSGLRRVVRRGKRVIDPVGPQVRRIFVFDDDISFHDQMKLIDLHVRIGVDSRVMGRGQQKPEHQEDFVIYDGAFVRYAEPLHLAGSDKAATLSVDPIDVRTYRRRFEEMWLRATPVSEYFASVSKQSKNSLNGKRAPIEYNGLASVREDGRGKIVSSSLQQMGAS
jgi:hypothetical protein